MKFKKPNGNVYGAVISQGARGGIVTQMDEQPTVIKDVKDPDKVILPPLDLNNCEIIEELEAPECCLKNSPKNLKRSIRDKYKKRQQWLAGLLDDFISHAKDRLDTTKAGKIRNRKETENIIKKCKKLLDILSINPPKDRVPRLNEVNLNRIFDIDSAGSDES